MHSKSKRKTLQTTEFHYRIWSNAISRKHIHGVLLSVNPLWNISSSPPFKGPPWQETYMYPLPSPIFLEQKSLFLDLLISFIKSFKILLFSKHAYVTQVTMQGSTYLLKYCREKLSHHNLLLGEYGWKHVAQQNFPTHRKYISHTNSLSETIYYQIETGFSFVWIQQ